jgi:hypothetical protein
MSDAQHTIAMGRCPHADGQNTPTDLPCFADVGWILDTAQLFNIARERRPTVLLSPKTLPILRPENRKLLQTAQAENQLMQVQQRK